MKNEPAEEPKKIFFSGHALQQMFPMRCAICKNGSTRSGTTTVTLQRGSTTVVIKDVPAQVCDNCGEYYLSDRVSAQVLEVAEGAVRRGAEIEVLRYAPVSV